jgi:signal peptide peptidase SppA
MKYTHILQYVASTPWAIAEEKMQDILSVLAFRAAGHQYTADEIRARIGDSEQSPASAQRGAIAVIPLRGVIAHRMGSLDESSGGMSAERFTGMVKTAAADPSVSTILIDCDSPGGTVPGVMEAAQAVFDAREHKRIIAVANAWMASAAYWIASQAHELVAIPSAFDRCIGSIGVVMVHQDLSEHLANEGIKVTMIRSGKNKMRVNPFEPLSEEAFADLKAAADATKVRFVKDVARGRGITAGQVVERFGDGLAFSAADAKAAGLIDRIATMDETIGKLVGRKSSVGMRAEALAAGTHIPKDLHDRAIAAGVHIPTYADEAAVDALEALVAAAEATVTLEIEADRRRRLERF